MKDLIWDIAKSGEENLQNTELYEINEPKELFAARGISLEAKDSTQKINKLFLLLTLGFISCLVERLTLFFAQIFSPPTDKKLQAGRTNGPTPQGIGQKEEREREFRPGRTLRAT